VGVKFKLKMDGGDGWGAMLHSSVGIHAAYALVLLEATIVVNWILHAFTCIVLTL